MPSLIDALSGSLEAAGDARGRAVVDGDLWRRLASELADGLWTLAGLWGDIGVVHMALVDAPEGNVAVASLDCDGRHFPPSPPATLRRPAWSAPSRISTAMSRSAPPTRGHGSTTDAGRSPPARRAKAGGCRRAPYAFLTAEGDELHQIPVGPVHAGVIEPGHFRFTAGGETIVRLEERLGYVHKGVDALMAGASLDRAAQLAGAGLRRQHGRLFHRFRPRRRRRARPRSAAARPLVARADGGTGAHRQPPRRHRRDLQRRRVRADARSFRRAARARLARRGRLFRPSADDGRVAPGGVRADLTDEAPPAPARAAARRFAQALSRLDRTL